MMMSTPLFSLPGLSYHIAHTISDYHTTLLGRLTLYATDNKTKTFWALILVQRSLRSRYGFI